MTESEAARIHRRYWRNKDEKDADLLIRHHHGFAAQIAARFVGPHVSYPDALGYALRGLHEAIKRYEPDLGAFTTFAYWWIFKVITAERAFAKNVVRIPVSIQRQSRKVQQMRLKGFSDREIAQEINVPVSEVETLANLHRNPVGEWFQNDRVIDDRSDDRQDVRREAEKRVMRDQIDRAMGSLRDIQKRIVLEHHDPNNPKTFNTLSEELNMSRQRVCDLYREAIKIIRQKCREP